MRRVEVAAGIRDRMTSRLERMSRTVERHGRSWQRMSTMAGRSARFLGAGLSRLDRMAGRLVRRLRFMVIGLQIAATLLGGSMVRSAMKYERALRNVTSLMTSSGLTTEQLNQKFVEMDSQIKQMAVRTGAMPQDLAAGMYDVVSSAFDAESGLKVLEAAAVGAFSGLTDVETTTNLLTSTLLSYRKESETTADVAKNSMTVMDMFFQAVNVGKFTFEELASSFGEVASTGAAFNISIEDMLAFLATATIRGVGMEEAITGLRQTILSIADTTPAVRKAATELFGSADEAQEKFSATAMATQGLHGVLSNLSEVIANKVDPQVLAMAEAMEDEGRDAASLLGQELGLTAEQFTSLFPNVRALKTVLAVTGPGMQTYAENLESIGDSAGATGRAQEEMAKSAEGALQFLKSVWQTFKIEVGNIALPFIKGIADSVVEWWGGLPERFARESGNLPPITPNMSITDLAGREERIQEIWAEAAPGDKIGFILQTAWADALDNLREWFDGDGKSRLEGIGERVGTIIGDGLMAIAGVGGEDVENSIGYKMGKAVWEGFKKGFTENFDAGEFFTSKTVLSIIGAIGALKVGPKLLGAFGRMLLGGAPPAAAAAGAGGGLGGFLGGLLGLANVGAIGFDLTQEGGWDSGFIGAIAGMFGIGQQNAWNRNPPGTTATAAESAAIQNNWISPASQSVVASQLTPAEISARKAFERGGKDIEQGGRVVDYAAADMRTAGRQQLDASARILMAADRFGNVRLGFPAFGPGSVAPSGPGPGGVSGPFLNARGSSGTVRKPTMFIAGEAGAEDFAFVPKGKGGLSGGAVVQGPLIGHVTVSSDYDVNRMLAKINRALQDVSSNG